MALDDEFATELARTQIRRFRRAIIQLPLLEAYEAFRADSRLPELFCQSAWNCAFA